MGITDREEGRELEILTLAFKAHGLIKFRDGSLHAVQARKSRRI